MSWPRQAPFARHAEALPVAAVHRLTIPSRDPRYDRLLRDVPEHGVVRPLVFTARADGARRPTLEDGHHRLLVASALGIEELPVVVRLVPGGWRRPSDVPWIAELLEAAS